MKGARRLFLALLALAVVCGATRFPAVAAESGYEMAVLTAQTLTQGTTFDPNTAPETGSVKAGDIVVLTLGFRNDSGAAVNVAGYAIKLLYDEEKAAPYMGTPPFSISAYQVSTELDNRGWLQAGNEKKGGSVLVNGISVNAYAVDSGATLVLCRIAFQINADASNGAAAFAFDPNETRVIDKNRQPLALNAFQPFDLTISADAASVPCEIIAVSTDKRAGTMTVTLSNPEAVTVAAAFFNADKRFVSAGIAAAQAQCGSVEIPLPDGLPAPFKARVALLDSYCTPLCSGFDANVA